MLHTPLSDGTCLTHKDVPFDVADERDYNRLIQSGKYKDITPEPAVATPTAAVPPTPVAPQESN